MSRLRNERIAEDTASLRVTQPAKETVRSHIAIPFAILSVAMATIFVALTVRTFTLRSNLLRAKAQLAEAHHAREPEVQRSLQAQKAMEKIARGLLKLSVVDRDAREIVQKYGIKSNEPGVSADVAAELQH